MSPRRILVTSALPYANGHIHLGHLVEYIQTDIWARFQKLRGQHCIYICADDTHGTAIMNRARQEGRSEEEVIADMSEAHQRDFAGFWVNFDHYGSTNSPQNRELCHEIWNALQQGGLVVEKEIQQLYDPERGMFLADRFVKGKCPVCGLPDQYGDSCDNGHTYSAAELIDPKSVYSGATPEVRSAKHLFIRIEQFHNFLEEWTQSGDHLQPEIASYLKGHFLGEPLRDWDISRPAPYFGFEIPETNGEHFWYVWFDAPIGYMASTKAWCEKHGEDFDLWWKNPETEIHHFIGKDITYFHTLFWPAMLKAAHFTLPKKIHIHGFLTVNAAKMSKTKGTFILASTYLQHLDPSFLRYYYASKLSNKVDDLDLNVEEFINRGNSDLVGKVVNLASRSAKFVQNVGLSKEYPEDDGLFQQAAAAGEEIAAAYEQCEYSKAMRQIMGLAEHANRYVEHHEPWKLRNDPDKAEQLQHLCTVALNLFRQIVIYLSPVLPKLAEQTGELLNDPLTAWDQAQYPLLGTQVNKFKHMLKRVETAQVEKAIESSKQEEPASPVEALAEDDDGPLKDEPLAEEITIDEFQKVDLRVARVLKAEEVPEARKLLKLTLSLGGEHTRTVFAGIKNAYDPQDLVGQLVVMVANLAPRKMKFGTSEGMVVASGPGGKEVFILRPDAGAKPGQRVH